MRRSKSRIARPGNAAALAPAIAGLLRFLRTRSMLVFVVYRVALGALLFALLLAGVIQP